MIIMIIIMMMIFKDLVEKNKKQVHTFYQKIFVFP